MIKELKLDYNQDGYDIMHTSCIDNALASAAGYYKRDLYFMYCFYFCVEHNWGDISSKDVFVISQKILNTLGLRIYAIPVESHPDFIRMVKPYISRGTPLVFFPQKKACFFSSDYKTGMGGIQAELITGYDDNRSLVVIRDALLDPAAFSDSRGAGLSRLQLPAQFIEKIYLDTLASYSEHHSERRNRLLLSVERQSNTPLPSLNSLYEVIATLNFR